MVSTWQMFSVVEGCLCGLGSEILLESHQDANYPVVTFPKLGPRVQLLDEEKAGQNNRLIRAEVVLIHLAHIYGAPSICHALCWVLDTWKKPN